MLGAFCLGMVGVFPVFAQDSTAKAASRMMSPQAIAERCPMKENAQLGVNFNNQPVELDALKDYMQSKIDEIQAIAADMGVEDLVVQSMNYNIYNNYGGGIPATKPSYMMNGNLAFTLGSASQGAGLMEKLGEKGYIVNFNMNAYRQCQ